MVDLKRLIYDQLILGILKMLQKLNMGYTVQNALEGQSEKEKETEKESDKEKEKEKEAQGKSEGKGKEKVRDEDKAKENEKRKEEGEGDEEVPTTDIGVAVQNLLPKIPKDFELFLNLVEFCKAILPIHTRKRKNEDSLSDDKFVMGMAIKKEKEEKEEKEKEKEREKEKESSSTQSSSTQSSLGSGGGESVREDSEENFFARWVYLFGREVICLSNDHPLISGFYKLLSIAFKNCETLNYFEGVPVDDLGADDDVIAMEAESNFEIGRAHV